LIEASIAYLRQQIDAGVDVVQIFDSWAGVLPMGEFRRWCLEPLRKIIAGVRAHRASVPIILFARGAGSHLVELARTSGADAIGLDTAVDLAFAANCIQTIAPVQGNLDPLALVAGGEGLDNAVDDIIRSLGTGPLIFNLGHGILPQTPIAHVERLVRRVRQSG